MNNSQELDFSYRDLLRDALKAVQSESFKNVPSEDEVSLEFSDGFSKTVFDAASKRSEAWKKLINSTSKKIAVIAVVIILGISSLMTVKAIRDPIISFVKRTYEESVALFSAKTEKIAHSTDTATGIKTEDIEDLSDDESVMIPEYDNEIKITDDTDKTDDTEE